MHRGFKYKILLIGIEWPSSVFGKQPYQPGHILHLGHKEAHAIMSNGSKKYLNILGMYVGLCLIYFMPSFLYIDAFEAMTLCNLKSRLYIVCV